MIYRFAKNIFFFSFLLFLSSCNESNNNYLISKGSVGFLKNQAKDLDSIFQMIQFKRIGEGDYMYSSEDKYLLYDKSGNHLLTLTPHQQHDLNEKIETIEIKMPNFQIQ